MQSLVASPLTAHPSKAHDPAEAQLAQFSDGSIVALSLSEPGRAYRVELSPARCECPGFSHRGRCYHVAAAASRYGTVQCGSCGQHIAQSEAHRNTGATGWNHDDYPTCEAFRGNIQRAYGVR